MNKFIQNYLEIQKVVILLFKHFLTPRILKWGFITVISLIWIGIYIAEYRQGNFIWGEIVEETGELAWGLLIFMIFLSLTQKIMQLHFPKFWLLSRLLPLRKWAGVFAFLIVIGHACATFAKEGVFGDIQGMIDVSFSTHHAAVFGSIAFLIMLPLFLTSTSWAVKTMGYKSWKNLQRFAHLAFVFTAVHVALLEYFGRGRIDWEPIGWLLAYCVGYLYLWTMKRRKK